MTTRTAKPASSKRSWPVPAALIALVTIPVIAGVLRLVQLFGGAATLPPSPRFDASPIPVVVHIVSAIVFATGGSFQFVPGLRRRRAWHRRAGRVVVVAGLGVALSALWLNQFFPRAHATRDIVYPLRWLFGVALVFTLVLGFRAVRRRDFARHRVWMIRSFAIALVAGTQVFTLWFGGAIFGTGDLAQALMIVGAWAINLAVAEWVVRRPARVGARRRAGATNRQLAPSDARAGAPS
jgi:uncharacterized membrane protein YozB (DUF420 family)